jgi:hypothetical protein
MTKRGLEMKFFDFLVRWGENNWVRNQERYEGIASYYKQILSTNDEKGDAKKQNSTSEYKASSMICNIDARGIHPGSQ